MFSEDIYDLNKLEKFCLEKYENISFISPDIKKLKNLLEFHLSYNPVSELPDEMNDLKHLEILNLFAFSNFTLKYAVFSNYQIFTMSSFCVLLKRFAKLPN